MTDDMNETIVAGTASLVLPIAIGAASGWPPWVIALVAAGLCAITAVAVRQRRQRRKLWELRAEQLRYESRHAVPPPVPPPVPVLPPGYQLTPVSLPSALPDYRFTFACTVHWQPDSGVAEHAVPAAVAADAVVRRASRITAGRHPEDDGTVHALAAALGQREADPGQRLAAWATEVRLELNHEDRDRLRRVADMRKQQHVWEQEVAGERAVRTYLRQDVLTSTGSTVVWWLARNTGQVREAVDLVDTLAKLSAAACDREVDDVFRHLANGAPAPFTVNGHSTSHTTDHTTGHGADDEHPDDEHPDDVLPDPEGHPVFGHQLANLLDRHEHPDRAQRARERYGVADWDTDNWDTDNWDADHWDTADQATPTPTTPDPLNSNPPAFDPPAFDLPASGPPDSGPAAFNPPDFDPPDFGPPAFGQPDLGPNDPGPTAFRPADPWPPDPSPPNSGPPDPRIPPHDAD